MQSVFQHVFSAAEKRKRSCTVDGPGEFELEGGVREEQAAYVAKMGCWRKDARRVANDPALRVLMLIIHRARGLVEHCIVALRIRQDKQTMRVGTLAQLVGGQAQDIALEIGSLMHTEVWMHDCDYFT